MLKFRNYKSGVTKVWLSGELIIYECQQLKEKMLPLMEGCNKLEINMAKVSELDTSCLQLLIQCKKEMEKRDKTFVITEMSKPVAAVMGMIRMNHFFGGSANPKNTSSRGRSQKEMS